MVDGDSVQLRELRFAGGEWPSAIGGQLFRKAGTMNQALSGIAEGPMPWHGPS